MKFVGQATGFLENILTFFSSGISPDPQQNAKHFNRKCKRSFERLVVFILYIVSEDTKGTDIKSGLLFKMAVYLTYLLDAAAFSRTEIADLCRRRWEVETHYRDEKVHLDIETFHTRGVNGIHQELFAVVYDMDMAS